MLQQDLEIVLVDVQRLEIHASPYYQIAYRLKDEPESASLRQMRINPEAFYSDPQPGDHVEVTMLMGNIMGAIKK